MQITRELKRWHIAVSPNTVRRLLRKLGYTLHANCKSFCTRHPKRDQQFRCIARQKRRFAKRSQPMISVDTKKKELVGNFKNPGRVWSLKPTDVKDHDFRSEALGMATPSGILDLVANQGSVFVGTSHNTPEFAARNVAQWWRDHGRKNHADASQLLILADSGGSNGARVRTWKWALQKQVADRFGLAVTVCHFPTGASKWNPIEHRLFSEISTHRAGQPLDSYQTIWRWIRETRTQTGLRVTSCLVSKHFETGKKVSNQDWRQLSIVRHRTLPEWNYTLLPRQNQN